MEKIPKRPFKRLCGDVVNCANIVGGGLKCGTTESCNDCVFRKSIAKAFDGEKTNRISANFQMVRNDEICKTALKVFAFPLAYEAKSFAVVVIEDTTEINELRSLLPICAWCKKVRDDKAYWHSVENYLENHMDISFTHGICPECRDKFTDELRQMRAIKQKQRIE
ncbi:MAG: hypothetical protein AB7V04_12085 [Desulfomonilaceae bacterium]